MRSRFFWMSLLKAAYQALDHLPMQRDNHVNGSPHEQAIAAWFAAEGDKTLRLDYDLKENSLVFDLGGFRGQWASDIYEKYNCYLHIFEPVSEYADGIRLRFLGNPKITVHQFGLADKTKSTMIGLAGDASSICRQDGPQEPIELVRASDFFTEYSIAEVDLVKINIEGGEYDLLEHLIDTGCVFMIRNIQVQFHWWAPNANQRMKSIQSLLGQSHYLTWQYPFVWENWRRRGD